LKEIDARGLDCPEPVIKTKKALEDYQGLTTIVDNEVAAKNVKRLAEKMKLEVEISRVENYFSIEIKRNNKSVENDKNNKTGKVYFIKSDKLGQGEDELGLVLMQGFIYTLLEVDPLPEKIIFINSGVKIPIKNEDAVESLEKLEEKGVNILACGTCLDYYELKEELVVGRVSNMYEILDSLNENEVISV
jgi:selenium metabolism protein YedF